MPETEFAIRMLLIILTSVAVSLPLTIYINKKLMKRAEKHIDEAVDTELKKRAK